MASSVQSATRNDYIWFQKRLHIGTSLRIQNSNPVNSLCCKLMQECWNATAIKSADFAMTKCHELYFAATTFCSRNAFPFNVFYYFFDVFINSLQHTVKLVSLWKGRKSFQKQIEKEYFSACFIYLCVSKEKLLGFRKGRVPASLAHWSLWKWNHIISRCQLRKIMLTSWFLSINET